MGAFSCSKVNYDLVLGLVGTAARATEICGSVDVSKLGAQSAVSQWTISKLESVQAASDQIQTGVNTSFILASAYQVFMMQAGFALFTAGVVRSKNIFNILMKNFIDACVASIMFYTIGYGLAFGSGNNTNGFIGSGNFGLSSIAGKEGANWAHFTWNWAFCAASATIVAGAVAERITFHAYLAYSTLISAFVYPVVVHWMWSSDGWLGARGNVGILGVGAIDFAGSGVVHVVGGISSLVGAYILGPRVGRFGSGLHPSTYRGHSAPLYVLGTMLLWFGWYGFNPGSVLRISDVKSAAIVSRVAIVTTLGATSGAVMAAVLSFVKSKSWNLLLICSGALAGLVSITGGAAVLEPWAALIGGSLGGAIFTYTEDFVESLGIDDPVSAFAMHGVCGLWGLLYVGLLAKGEYIQQVYGAVDVDHQGVFYGGDGKLLLCQIIAMVVIPLWVAANVVPLFWGLKRMKWLRVSVDEEVMGLDRVTNGEALTGDAPNIHSAKVRGTRGVHLRMGPVKEVVADMREPVAPQHQGGSQ